ncbi:MAG: polysaccharide deacetylase family protein [Chloroflexi bacterium]|nr:polysaccharide deacetylase family protein [Chloroflexota bacterium]
MDVLDKHHVKASVPINADACEHYPVIVEEGKKRGWEFLGHGITNSETLAGLTEEEERQVIRHSLDTVEKAVGWRPSGWRGPGMAETFNTPDILAEEGIKYLSDWYNDDQPYSMAVRGGSLISLPASIGTSDLHAFHGEHRTPEQFFETIKNAFDTMHCEGASQPRILSISLHPYVIGHSFRIWCLDKALSYIRSHKHVWFATGWEIADWYRKTAPRE